MSATPSETEMSEAYIRIKLKNARIARDRFEQRISDLRVELNKLIDLKIIEDNNIAHFEALPTSAADTPPARWMDKHMLRAKDDTRNIPFASTREGIAAARAGDVDALRSLWFKYRTTDGERFRACPMPHTLSLW